METIKTLSEVSRVTFDKKVNEYLQAGWKLSSTYINPLPISSASLIAPVRYYAVLVQKS